MPVRIQSKVKVVTTSFGKHFEKTISSRPASVVVGIEDEELAAIAYYHEFGTSSIPRRSFLRPFFEENNKIVIQMLRDYAYTRLYKSDAAGFDVLKQIGIFCVEGLRKSILANIPPPLKEATVKSKESKGYSMPEVALYATGNMYNSIAWRLVRRR
jgi:hypothetical protein